MERESEKARKKREREREREQVDGIYRGVCIEVFRWLAHSPLMETPAEKVFVILNYAITGEDRR